MPSLPFNGYYLTLGLLVACTAIGILVAARFRREVDHDLAPTTTKELLGPLERAYHSGLMHPAEIERIRESVKKTKLLDSDPAKASSRSHDSSGAGLLLPTDGGPFPDDPSASHPDGGDSADAG